MKDLKDEIIIKLWKGDCLELMKNIPDSSVDLVLTDPPYGTTACKWDSIINLELMWKQLNRIIKKDGVIVMTSSQPFTTKLIHSNINNFKHCWVWNKKKGGNIMSLKYQPYKIHEDIVVFSNGKIKYNPIKVKQKERTGKTYSEGLANGIKNYGDERIYKDKYPKSIIEISNANNKNKLHPTQKPVELLSYLIKTYSNQDDLVLDFTMGSGSTGIACIETNRKFVGIELDENYYKIAEKRIQDRLQSIK
jgi:site-specific DNA-methyltransferase (adenine-specific)